MTMMNVKAILLSIFLIQMIFIQSNAQGTVDPNVEPTDPVAVCKYEQLGLYINPIEGLALRSRQADTTAEKKNFGKVDPDSYICNNINDQTCCTTPMLKAIKAQWSDVLKNERYGKYLGAIHTLIEEYYNALSEYAESQFQSYLKIYKKEKEEGVIKLQAFNNLYQKNYSIKIFHHSWKANSKKCFAYMADVTKGAFCAMCDKDEYTRFQNTVPKPTPAPAPTPAQPDTPENQTQRNLQNAKGDVEPAQKEFEAYLSPADAFAFSINCTDYLNEHYELLRFLKEIEIVFLYKRGSAIKNLKPAPPLPTQGEISSMLNAMVKCRDNSQDCLDQLILSQFWINIGTKLDLEWHEYVVALADEVAYEFSDETLENHQENTDRRILQNVESTSDKRDLQMKFDESSKGFSQFFDPTNANFSDAQATKFKISSEYINLLSTMDTILPSLDTENIEVFKSEGNCPLAPQLGGIIAWSIFTREKPTICKSVEKSCCTPSTWVSFENDWKIGRYMLDRLYESEKTLDNFLMNDLADRGKEWFKAFPEDEDAEGCKGEVDNAKCVILYKTLEDAITHAKFYYDQYKLDWKKCHELQENVRLQMRCAACDSTANQFFDAKNKIVNINVDQVNSLITACYDQDLFRNKLLREVYLAYLNYAKQVNPNLTLGADTLYYLFSNKIMSCSEWMKRRGNTGEDINFISATECLDYGYEKFTELLGNPSEVKISPALLDYFRNIVRTVANNAAFDKVDEIIPDIIKPKKETFGRRVLTAKTHKKRKNKRKLDGLTSGNTV